MVNAAGTTAYITSASGVAVLNTTTNAITTTITTARPGAGAAALSSDGKTLYVAGTDRSLTLVDTATNNIISTAQTGTDATALAVSPDGTHVYLTDPVTNSLRTVTLTAPVDTPPAIGSTQEATSNTATGAVTGQINATDADGDTLTYSVGSGPAQGSVTLDPTTGAFTYTPTTAARLSAAVNALTLYYGFYSAVTDSFTVNVSDGQTTTAGVVTVPIESAVLTPTSPVAVGSSPSGVSTSNGLTYVTNSGSNTVSVINSATNTVVSTITVGKTPDAVAISPNGTTAYVANSGANTVSVINAATDTVTATLKTGTTPDALVVSPDGTRLYVINAGGTVTKINTSTNTVTSAIKTGANPQAAIVSADGKTVYVVNTGADTLTAITTATNGTKTITGIGADPTGITLAPNGTTAYITTPTGITVLDTATNTVTGTVADTAGSSDAAIAVSPDGTVLAITHTDGSVDLVNTATLTSITTASTGTGSGPTHLTFSTDGTTLYGTNPATNAVTVLTLAEGPDIPTAPVLASDSVTTDGVVTGTLTATDPGGQALSYELYQNPSWGSLTFNADGTFTYTPTSDAQGLASLGWLSRDFFYVLASNGTYTSDYGAVYVPITPTPDTVGTPGSVGQTTGAHGVVTGQLVATEPVDVQLTYTVTGSPADGALTIDSWGDYTYTPTTLARVQAGAGTGPTTDSFTVTATNGTYTSDAGTITVPIAAIASDTPTTPASGAQRTSSSGVVTGQLSATDPAGLPLTYTATTDPANGTVTVTSTGAYTYTPTTTAEDQSGVGGPTSDAFTVTASNGTYTSAAGRITVPITAIPDTPTPPTPSNQSTTTSGVVSGQLTATDPVGLPLTYTATTNPANGTVTVTPSGAYTYTPTTAAQVRAGDGGPTTDSFTVTTSNGYYTSSATTVTVPITAIASDTPTTPSGPSHTTSSSGVVTGQLSATDPAGLPLTYTATTNPANGTVTVTSTGAYTYTPTTLAQEQASVGGATAFACLWPAPPTNNGGSAFRRPRARPSNAMSKPATPHRISLRAISVRRSR